MGCTLKLEISINFFQLKPTTTIINQLEILGKIRITESQEVTFAVDDSYGYIFSFESDEFDNYLTYKIVLDQVGIEKICNVLRDMLHKKTGDSYNRTFILNKTGECFLHESNLTKNQIVIKFSGKALFETPPLFEKMHQKLFGKEPEFDEVRKLANTSDSVQKINKGDLNDTKKIKLEQKDISWVGTTNFLIWEDISCWFKLNGLDSNGESKLLRALSNKLKMGFLPGPNLSKRARELYDKAMKYGYKIPVKANYGLYLHHGWKNIVKNKIKSNDMIGSCYSKHGISIDEIIMKILDGYENCGPLGSIHNLDENHMTVDENGCSIVRPWRLLEERDLELLYKLYF